jgi:hypothetical protein
MHHTADRGGRIVEDHAADLVDAGNVNERMHHRDVARADEGAEGAHPAGERGDDELGESGRQDLHGGSGHDAALGAAHGNDTVDPVFGMQLCRQDSAALEHPVDGQTPGAHRSQGR